MKIGALTPKVMEGLVTTILNERQRVTFHVKNQVDFAHSIPGVSRFRVNMFRQRGSVSMVLRVISNDTKPVIVPYGKGAEIIREIQTRAVPKGQPRFSRDDLRNLQRYIVNLYSHQFRQLEALKQVTPLLPNLELYVLSAGLYHPQLGLVTTQRPSEDFIL